MALGADGVLEHVAVAKKEANKPAAAATASSGRPVAPKQPWHYKVDTSRFSKGEIQPQQLLAEHSASAHARLSSNEKDLAVTRKLVEKLSDLRQPGACAMCTIDIKDGDACTELAGCQHSTFHWQCPEEQNVRDWLKKDGTCPICRQEVANPSKDAIKVVFNRHANAEMRLKDQLKDAEKQYLEKTGIKGSNINGAKTTAMLQELKEIKDKDATAAGLASVGSKVIIFSQWKEVLKKVHAGLHLDDIMCAFPSKKGKDRNAELQHFKTSTETFVLLLLVSEGAEGLDLTHAN